VKDYKELEVWRKTKVLAVELYRTTGHFPRSELFGLTAPIRRAATSIAANITEGWGRGSTREYIQFLLIARGSLLELETHLLIAGDLGYLKPDEAARFQGTIQSIGQMLNRLIQVLRNGSKHRLTSPGSRVPSPI
jgi:four helix bundle protein